jgi:hypothetical protein
MGAAASGSAYSALRATIENSQHIRLGSGAIPEASDEDEKQCLKDVTRENFVVNGKHVAGSSLLSELSAILAILDHEERGIKSLMLACSRTTHGGEAYAELQKLLPLSECLLKPATVSCKATEIRFAQRLPTSSNYEPPTVEIDAFSVFQLLRDEDIDSLDVEDNLESRVGLIVQTVTKNVLHWPGSSTRGPSRFACADRSLSIEILAPSKDAVCNMTAEEQRSQCLTSWAVCLFFALPPSLYILCQLKDDHLLPLLVALGALGWWLSWSGAERNIGWVSVAPAKSGLRPMSVRG